MCIEPQGEVNLVTERSSWKSASIPTSTHWRLILQKFQLALANLLANRVPPADWCMITMESHSALTPNQMRLRQNLRRARLRLEYMRTSRGFAWPRKF